MIFCSVNLAGIKAGGRSEQGKVQRDMFEIHLSCTDPHQLPVGLDKGSLPVSPGSQIRASDSELQNLGTSIDTSDISLNSALIPDARNEQRGSGFSSLSISSHCLPSPMTVPLAKLKGRATVPSEAGWLTAI